MQSALDDIWTIIGGLDGYIQKEEPFKKIKVDEDGAKKDVSFLLAQLEGVGKMLVPFMPDTSKAISEALEKNKKPENLFNRLEK